MNENLKNLSEHALLLGTSELLSKNEEHCFLKEIGFYSADWQHIPGIDDASYCSPIFYCYNYQEAVNYCLHGPNLNFAPGDEGIY